MNDAPDSLVFLVPSNRATPTLPPLYSFVLQKFLLQSLVWITDRELEKWEVNINRRTKSEHCFSRKTDAIECSRHSLIQWLFSVLNRTFFQLVKCLQCKNACFSFLILHPHFFFLHFSFLVKQISPLQLYIKAHLYIGWHTHFHSETPTFALTLYFFNLQV